jgi:hypothetical protein
VIGPFLVPEFIYMILGLPEIAFPCAPGCPVGPVAPADPGCPVGPVDPAIPGVPCGPVAPAIPG